MTIPEIATQLHKLSINGQFNHKEFTRLDLLHYIRDAFQWRVRRLSMEIILRRLPAFILKTDFLTYLFWHWPESHCCAAFFLWQM